MAATVSHVAERVDRTIKSIIPAEQEPKLEEGKAILRRYLNPPFGFTMENEIAKARNVIKNLKDFPAYIDGKLVSNQIKNADAVVFLTTGRAGLFLTGHLGSGLVVSRLGESNWSAPSSILYLGTGLGLQGGFDVTDYVIILKRQAVDSFIGSNQLVLGGDVGVTPIIGRHGTADLHIGKRTGIALGWAASKGWYAGAAAQAGIIRTRGDVNKKFYGKEVDPADLLHGKVSKPRAARALYDALNDLP